MLDQMKVLVKQVTSQCDELIVGMLVKVVMRKNRK
jgi:hypothetical protein